MEIERKFLVDKLPEMNINKYDNIKQYYLSLDPEIRIRNKNDKTYLMTVKSSGGMIRKETEFEITESIFKELIEVSISCVSKTRHYIGRLEFDIYFNIKDLMTVEIEFDSEKEANEFIPLDWFGKEVTYDKRYKNKNLAIKRRDE